MDTQNPLNVLILNASLKHAPDPSATQEVADLVVSEMQKLSPVTAVSVRLADKNIPVGLGFNEGPGDEWPAIVEEIKKATSYFLQRLFVGGRSSLMQRVIERMDAFDEEAHTGGRAVLLNKVAGIVITGSEDGAQAVMAGIIEVLSFLNFTIPPQACTYWVGETGLDPKTDSERRRANKAVPKMAQATAKNLVFYANLLKANPQSA